jgi:hypothetical protein
MDARACAPLLRLSLACASALLLFVVIMSLLSTGGA